MVTLKECKIYLKVKRFIEGCDEDKYNLVTNNYYLLTEFAFRTVRY